MISNATLARAAVAVRHHAGAVVCGRLARVTGQLMELHLAGARIGEFVDVDRAGERLLGEVVGLRDGIALAVPFGDLRGVKVGARVHRAASGQGIPASAALRGRVIDVFGHAIDGGPPIRAPRIAIDAPPKPVDQRAAIDRRFDTGVRVLDGLLTLGRGQRVGIFAGAGVGKTVLMRQLIAQCQADVTVVGLIGERGCEVHDLLTSSARARSVVVAATSDRSPVERARGAQAATAIAEHFRDAGANVLLVLDSLTRYAMALREIGLAAGELPATKGYPASVFATLPRLLERVLPVRGGGSITGVYTVLVEGDDLADPVADAARSLLDGHIVLSRDLAARGHFPAVDVLASASRVARRVTTAEVQLLADRARELLATRREVEELRSLGAYTPGASPEQDLAIAFGRRMDGWLRQRASDAVDYDDTIAELRRLLHEATTAR